MLRGTQHCSNPFSPLPMLQSKTLPLPLQHTDTEPVQPPPVSICLRAQRSKYVGDHTHTFFALALSRAVVGSWQSQRDLHRASAAWSQPPAWPEWASFPTASKSFRESRAGHCGETFPFLRAAPWRLQRNTMSLDLKQWCFPTTCPNASPSEDNWSSLSLKSRYKALCLPQLHFSLITQEDKAALQTSVTWTLLACFALQATYPPLRIHFCFNRWRKPTTKYYSSLQWKISHTCKQEATLGRGTQPILEVVFSLKIVSL